MLNIPENFYKYKFNITKKRAVRCSLLFSGWLLGIEPRSPGPQPGVLTAVL